MRGLLLAGVVLVGILFLASAGLAASDESGPVGLVAALEGSVQVSHRGETEFSPVRVYQDVLEGDRFRTGENGKVEILFQDDSMVVLGSGSELEITAFLYRRESKERKALMGLLGGKLRFLVTRFFLEKDPDFQFQTSSAVVGVRGTDGILRVLNPTLVYCLTGNLRVQSRSTGEVQEIGPMTKAVVEKDQPIVVQPIDPGEAPGLLQEFFVAVNLHEKGIPAEHESEPERVPEHNQPQIPQLPPQPQPQPPPRPSDSNYPTTINRNTLE